MPRTKHLTVLIVALLQNPDGISLPDCLLFQDFAKVEKMLIGGYGPGHAVIYTDFEKFKRINAKYGYRVGDQILRQFSEYVISVLKTDMDVYFTRAISDHFILFTPCDIGCCPKHLF